MLQERAYYLKLRLAEKTMRCSRRSLVALTALSFACLQSDPPSAPVVAAKLAFVRQPTNTFQGTLIAPFVQVAAEDSAGARATGFTDVITLSLTSSSPGGTTLSGNAVAAIDGIATFTELQVNQPGSGYTLTATATGIARATSTAFDVAAVLGKSALSLYVANAMPRAFAPSNVPYSVAVFAPGATGNARPALAFKDAFIAPFGIAVDGAGRVYVACYTAIMIYGTSTGTPERVAMIAGSNTGLAQPAGVALDRTGNVYVANYGNSTITVYAAGASGDATPIATIAGSNTLLSGPNGIAVDTSGNLYVANFQYPPGAGVSRITVFAVGASGNVAPTAMIQGSSTALAAPWGIALDSAENLYVANSYGGSVTVYAPGANGNEPPAVTIAGSNTGLNILTGLAVDATGRIYVGDGRQRVYVFAAGASGNVAPIATIGGDITGLNIPYALAVGGSGTLYASNFMVNTVTLYPAGANGNVPPTTTIRAGDLYSPAAIAVSNGRMYVSDQTGNSLNVFDTDTSLSSTLVSKIVGANTGLDAPKGIAVGPTGRLYVATYGVDGPAITGTINIYAAGAIDNVAPTATITGGKTGLSDPNGIALDAAGMLYVANRVGNSITVYAAGASGDASPTVTIAGDKTGLHYPIAIALDSTGALYVANHGDASGAGSSVTIYPPGASGNAVPRVTLQGDQTGLAGPGAIAVDELGDVYVANDVTNAITIYYPGASGNVKPTATISGSSTGLSAPSGLTFHK